jgi:hypothetical protein
MNCITVKSVGWVHCYGETLCPDTSATLAPNHQTAIPCYNPQVHIAIFAYKVSAVTMNFKKRLKNLVKNLKGRDHLKK